MAHPSVFAAADAAHLASLPVPVIDVTSPDAPAAIAAAASTLGAFYATHTAVRQSTVDVLLGASRGFFDAPPEVKRRYKAAAPSFRGYTPLEGNGWLCGGWSKQRVFFSLSHTPPPKPHQMKNCPPTLTPPPTSRKVSTLGGMIRQPHCPCTAPTCGPRKQTRPASVPP